MHAELAILAKTLGLRVVYVDSLTWFRPIWDEVDVSYYQRFLAMRDLTSEELEITLGILQFANMYDVQWAAHLVAVRSCVQEIFPLTKQALDILELRGGYTPVGAIVDPRFFNAAAPTPNTVLVNLGACHRNPHYIEWTVQVFSKVAEALPAYSFAVHGPDLEYGDRSLPQNLKVAAISRSEFIAALSSSALVFSPPGLTFFLEATALGYKVFILPAQHAGQVKNSAKLRTHFPTLPSLSWALNQTAQLPNKLRPH